MPRRALGRDYGRPSCQRLRHGDREVLVQGRKNEEIGLLIGGDLGVA